ncbi:hypothetical protein GCM10010294_07150 [Streptomyces griseoloalbus]|uniref:hypothetical protein n=1 Tax=Streptomyces griseoloalbus TaxID=67303 RepID=UPI0019B6AC5C|nr:hypothetical protein GCM10010294_07150 [Streptomyces griseoloalbus]
MVEGAAACPDLPGESGPQNHSPSVALAEHLPEFETKLARDAAPLPDWPEQLTTARLPVLADLAKAIREDQPAVVQGITTPLNSGVNEGRITDLKLQKRITAGRAGVPLLRHRVVLMALLRRAILPGPRSRVRRRWC